MNSLKEKWLGFYALRLYFPLSSLIHSFRAFSRKMRIKQRGYSQGTLLPQTAWNTLVQARSIRLVETTKRDGNVRISELGFIAQVAASVMPNQTIIEIGTFDGRTTLNLAVNAHPSCPIVTLDLPITPSQTVFRLDAGEERYTKKPVVGDRYKNCTGYLKTYTNRIIQLLGDSATINWMPFHRKAGLIFIDGSHAYDYVIQDSHTAFQLILEGGVILWHDYGVWEGVTKALEEIEDKYQLGLKHVAGTSLVYLKAKTNVPALLFPGNRLPQVSHRKI